MRRMSILPLSAACGGAAALSAQYGAGRPAAMSSAFHGSMAKAPGWEDLLARLSDVERAEVQSWKPPATVVLGDVTLDYASAEKESALGLDEFGSFCLDAYAITIGHMDFGWVRGINGHSIGYVADIKRQVYTTPDGPESLQLHAYGRAFAEKHHCAGYCTGLWLATEGEWLWSKEVVMLGSPRADQLFERIRAAATAEGEYSTGEHCRHCYARTHCPEWALPVALAPTWLGPVAAGNLPSDPEKAAELVLQIQHAEDILDKAKKNLQEGVRRGEIVVRDPKSGKVWGPVEMTGRESSLSPADLRGMLGESAEQYIRRGAAFQQFRWLKAAT